MAAWFTNLVSGLIGGGEADSSGKSSAELEKEQEQRQRRVTQRPGGGSTGSSVHASMPVASIPTLLKERDAVAPPTRPKPKSEPSSASIAASSAGATTGPGSARRRPPALLLRRAFRHMASEMSVVTFDSQPLRQRTYLVLFHEPIRAIRSRLVASPSDRSAGRVPVVVPDLATLLKTPGIVLGLFCCEHGNRERKASTPTASSRLQIRNRVLDVVGSHAHQSKFFDALNAQLEWQMPIKDARPLSRSEPVPLLRAEEPTKTTEALSLTIAAILEYELLTAYYNETETGTAAGVDSSDALPYLGSSIGNTDDDDPAHRAQQEQRRRVLLAFLTDYLRSDDSRPPPPPLAVRSVEPRPTSSPRSDAPHQQDLHGRTLQGWDEWSEIEVDTRPTTSVSSASSSAIAPGSMFVAPHHGDAGIGLTRRTTKPPGGDVSMTAAETSSVTKRHEQEESEDDNAKKTSTKRRLQGEKRAREREAARGERQRKRDLDAKQNPSAETTVLLRQHLRSMPDGKRRLFLQQLRARASASGGYLGGRVPMNPSIIDEGEEDDADLDDDDGDDIDFSAILANLKTIFQKKDSQSKRKRRKRRQRKEEDERGTQVGGSVTKKEMEEKKKKRQESSSSSSSDSSSSSSFSSSSSDSSGVTAERKNSATGVASKSQHRAAPSSSEDSDYSSSSSSRSDDDEDSSSSGGAAASSRPFFGGGRDDRGHPTRVGGRRRRAFYAFLSSRDEERLIARWLILFRLDERLDASFLRRWYESASRGWWRINVSLGSFFLATDQVMSDTNPIPPSTTLFHRIWLEHYGPRTPSPSSVVASAEPHPHAMRALNLDTLRDDGRGLEDTEDPLV